MHTYFYLILFTFMSAAFCVYVYIYPLANRRIILVKMVENKLKKVYRTVFNKSDYFQTTYTQKCIFRKIVWPQGQPKFLFISSNIVYKHYNLSTKCVIIRIAVYEIFHVMCCYCVINVYVSLVFVVKFILFFYFVVLCNNIHIKRNHSIYIYIFWL